MAAFFLMLLLLFHVFAKKIKIIHMQMGEVMATIQNLFCILYYNIIGYYHCRIWNILFYLHIFFQI